MYPLHKKRPRALKLPAYILSVKYIYNAANCARNSTALASYSFNFATSAGLGVVPLACAKVMLDVALTRQPSR